MRTAGFCALFLLAFLPCFADMEPLHRVQEEFFKGYTVATVEGYHVKIIAEQRRSDRIVQIIVIPEQQGVRFHIQNVQFGKMPLNGGPEAAVAKVHGSFIFQSSNAGNIRNSSFRRMIPVEVAPVNEFSLSADEARIQGNTVFQRDLPRMLSEE